MDRFTALVPAHLPALHVGDHVDGVADNLEPGLGVWSLHPDQILEDGGDGDQLLGVLLAGVHRQVEQHLNIHYNQLRKRKVCKRKITLSTSQTTSPFFGSICEDFRVFFTNCKQRTLYFLLTTNNL